MAQSTLDKVRGLSQALHPVDSRGGRPRERNRLVHLDGRAADRHRGIVRAGAGRRVARRAPSPFMSIACSRRR